MRGDIALEALAIARAWVGTPYQHQASRKDYGADCLGLLRGIWRELYGGEPELIPAYSPDWSEPSREELLLAAAKRHAVEKPINAPAPGDIILFRMRAGSVAKHLGIAANIGDAPSFIHAYSGHGVVESPLSLPWSQRITARFEFPGKLSRRS